jgi:dTMP kinase
MFITFEGVEGCGKSTQVKRLAEFLAARGKEVLVTREPGGTPVAEKIRAILLDKENQSLHYLTELLLYAASRAQHVQELILPALAAGKTVICDRFFDSTLAYQGYGRDIDRELIYRLNDVATQGVKPDLTFILDIPPEQGLERIKAKRGSGTLDRLELENLDFHRRVRAGFLALAMREPDRVKVIDGLQHEDQVINDIAKYLGYR